MNRCKNCSEELIGNYCYQCGQKAKTERISWKYITGQIIYFFTHLETGFLYTTLQMIARPGYVVISFLEGKRKSYQPPVSYFLIWTGITILLLLATESYFGKNQVINYNGYYGPAKSTDYAVRNLTYFLFAIFPFLSLYFWIVCSNFIYNYFESLITVFYVIGTIVFLQSCFVIVSILFHLVSGLSVHLVLSDPLKIFVVSWFAITFLKRFPVNHKIIRGIVFVLLSFGSYTFWRVFAYPWLATKLID